MCKGWSFANRDSILAYAVHHGPESSAPFGLCIGNERGEFGDSMIVDFTIVNGNINTGSSSSDSGIGRGYGHCIRGGSFIEIITTLAGNSTARSSSRAVGIRSGDTEQGGKSRVEARSILGGRITSRTPSPLQRLDL
jgi:hypothetical protein